jgi:hypothetical protein
MALMFDSIKTALTYLTYPQWRDYIKMGQGISWRANNAKYYWDKHLLLSKVFQKSCCELANNLESISILGAGELFDVDSSFIQKNFKKIEFWDANPRAIKSWRKFEKKLANNQEFASHLADLTFSIFSWTEDLRSFLIHSKSKDIFKLANFFDRLETASVELSKISSDVVVSLNLLSQIPIYWRDRAHSLINKLWSIDTDENGFYPRVLQESFNNTMLKLQEQHLLLLISTKAKLIVLISDREFLYYNQNKSLWQSEKALYVPKNLLLDSYKIVKEDSWLWHIAPQGLENNEYGEIHDVVAKGYLRL